MDKDELKQILREQFEPFEKAVQKKLEYLQSDNVFADMASDYYSNAPVTDSSLEDAFDYFSEAKPIPAYREPQENIDSAEPRNMASISERKQNIAARIAAMRGISMPGDYIDDK